jgi:hypothetical protein
LLSERTAAKSKLSRLFTDRELRLLDPALDGPPYPVAHLQLGQALQVTGVVGPFGGALTGQLIVLPQKVGSLSAFR